MSRQVPLFDLDALVKTSQHFTWRERIKASFGYDPLKCPRSGQTMELVEIWEPNSPYTLHLPWVAPSPQRLRQV